MLIVLFEIVLAVCLLSLLWIFLGRFCQLSNDDRDDFNPEWKELNRPRASAFGFQKITRFFYPATKTAPQSGRGAELDNVNRTRNAPGKS